ncbi:hypothetical protein EDB81DRAFT_931588 [Dactylonectria macrodidyma]|uniref:Chromo domain-containing protein n=1 Tax=Dactylonectria macrodidyma TaxID=307937 RepID=A0A9P9JDK4_9HYPO|nr:hypothetical protein EDB81DRAFT_931588 [Dactylonectria macrodidyma]
MPPTKKKPTKAQTIFLGRQTPISREEIDTLRRSIEADADDDDQQVVSDLLYDSDNKSEAPDSPPLEERAEIVPTTKRARSSPSPDKTDSATAEKPSKRQRRAKNVDEAAPRRSTRLGTVSVAPKEEPVPAKPEKRGRGRPRREPENRGTEEEWEIEKIVDAQIDAITQEHFYHVKWKGFPSSANTWEPKKNLTGCSRAIQAFEKGLNGSQ